MSAKLRPFEVFLFVLCGIVFSAMFLFGSWLLGSAPVVGVCLLCVLIGFVGFCIYFSIKSFIEFRRLAKVFSKK